jgi:Raf kinase inhibitor-like YbhB/YbcL family protein
VSIPETAKSLALIMHDPDAPSGDYVHWTLWDIPADTGTLAANSVPVGAVQGINSSGENKYMGPCPPSGTHRYMFELYALDTSLSLPAETQREDLLKTMEGRVLEKATLTGTFSA